MPEQEIGTVIHYFKGPSVAVIRLTGGELALGDQVRIVGHTSDFTETIGSMEVNHQRVERAQTGDDVAVHVVARARPHDRVVKVTSQPSDGRASG
jgi:translation elongation factor EF-Tu-like GTPase